MNFSIDRLPVHQSTKRKDYEKDHEHVFGYVSKSHDVDGVHVCVERISENSVTVFLNHDSGEVVKLLGDSIYSHYNSHDYTQLCGDTAHNNDKITSTSRIVARAHIQKNLKHELGIKNTKRNRINIAGIKLSQSTDTCDIPDINPAIVTDSLFILADAATDDTVFGTTFDAEMVNLLFEFIGDAADKTEKNKCMPDLTPPISVRNSSIDNRNFGYA